MPHVYLDERVKPPVWRYQIWDHNRKRKTFTGTTSHRETLEAAQRRHLFEKEIRDGVRERPKPDHRKKPFADTVDEYFAWGESQGGRGGRPWAKDHARCRRQRLTWWKGKLSVNVLGDLKGILPIVEKILRELQANNRSGKTLAQYAEALVAFCKWCIARDYLNVNPLKALHRFDTTPRTTRRLLTAEDMVKLLDAVSDERRLLYETALSSGLRLGELKALKVGHLDIVNVGLRLDANWTKNRKPGFQPLPTWMVQKLEQTCTGKAPDQALLKVPCNASQRFDTDIRRAGIPKWTDQGKLDFHAMRVAYITNVIEAGADIKTAQTLARHSTPQLTLGIYAKTRPERLKAMAEAIGNIFPDSSKNVPNTVQVANA